MRFEIKNFRSIKEQEIELAPITVIYGPNGSGKSSLLYALLTLQNVVLNPYQTPNEFFNYIFANLGGFEAVVFDHQTRNEIELGVTLEKDRMSLTYQVVIGENRGSFALSVECSDFDAKFQLPVSFPYPANQQTQQTISHKERIFIVTWNGITAEVRTKAQVQKEAIRLAASFNAPIEMLRKVSIVPLKRGFSKPFYSPVPIFPMMVTEDEIATFLSMNKRLVQQKLSFYLEQILERDFRVNFKPGIAVFSLDCTDKKTGVASEIVNEGFGVNQIVYLLARCLYYDTEWVCIEEPEIHLHPTAVRRVAKALVQISRDEEKSFVISTHSESFLLALITLVAQGELEPSKLACYLAQKEKKSTQFECQPVNEKGQIEGGLTSFLEGELEDVATFLRVAK